MRVLYPGSFDPFHEGHLAVVERAAAMFDEVVVAAIVNPGKARGAPLEQRQAQVAEAVAHLPNVEVVCSAGLTTDLATAVGAAALVRGVARGHRSELELAYANEQSAGIPTIFVPASASTRHVSSTAVRTLQVGTALPTAGIGATPEA